MDQQKQRTGGPARVALACPAGRRSAGRLTLLALAVAACATVAGCSSSGQQLGAASAAVPQLTHRVVLQGPVPLGRAPLAVVLPVTAPAVAAPVAAAPVAAAPVAAAPAAARRVLVGPVAAAPGEPDAQIADAAVLRAPADAARETAQAAAAEPVEPAEPFGGEPADLPQDPPPAPPGAPGADIPLPPGAPPPPSAGGAWGGAVGATPVVGAPPVLPDSPEPRGRRMSRNPFAPPGTPGALRTARPVEVAPGAPLAGPVPGGRTPLRQAPGRTVRIGPVPVLPGSVRTPGAGPTVEVAVLGPGASGDGVRQVQRLLAEHGWRGRVDGVYGPQTGLGVQTFQRRRGLGVDGIVGRQTWAALRGRDGQP